MKILVTGASGVIGTGLVSSLIERGHDVSALVRSGEAAQQVERNGARAVSGDLFDRGQVASLVGGADIVFNLATAIPPLAKMGRRRAWALNDRLRTSAVDNLVMAAREAGAERFIQPSIAFLYADGADSWLDEESPIDPPASATESALHAEASTHRFTSGGGSGVVLRLGRLYGPGPVSAEHVGMLRKSGGLIVGDGSNFVPSLHVRDAVQAMISSISVDAGTYNVVDDAPARSGELTAAQSAAVGGREPRTVRPGVARLFLGDAVSLLTVSQRVANRRFREMTGWRPEFPDAIAGAASLI